MVESMQHIENLVGVTVVNLKTVFKKYSVIKNVSLGELQFLGFFGFVLVL